LERCCNQDETIYSDADNDFDLAIPNYNSMVSSSKNSETGLNSEELNYFEELLMTQKQQNLNLNNCKFHSEFYTDAKVYEKFIQKFPQCSVFSFKVLKNMHSKSIASQMQTIQPARRHSYSDEENRAILEAYKNSFLIDHQLHL
jgi:hypothetical protein